MSRNKIKMKVINNLFYEQMQVKIGKLQEFKGDEKLYFPIYNVIRFERFIKEMLLTKYKNDPNTRDLDYINSILRYARSSLYRDTFSNSQGILFIIRDSGGDKIFIGKKRYRGIQSQIYKNERNGENYFIAPKSNERKTKSEIKEYKKYGDIGFTNKKGLIDFLSEKTIS